jgi:hypothetical protein
MSTEPGNGRRRINDLTLYQRAAYHNIILALDSSPVDVLHYVALGLHERADVIMKMISDGNRPAVCAQLPDELGNILFYTARLASVLGADLGEIAADNLRKMM